MNYPYARSGQRRLKNIVGPVKGSRSTSIVRPTPGSSRAYPSHDSRISELERRLTATEHSHGALLKEMLILREEMKTQVGTTTGKNRQLVIEDASSCRQATEKTPRISGDALAQVADQVQQLVDRQASDAETMSSLQDLIKTVEQTMMAKLKDAQHKIDLCCARTNELSEAMNDLQSSVLTDEQQNYDKADEQKLLQSLNSLQGQLERALERQRGSLGGLEMRHLELEHQVERENIRVRGEIVETTDDLARRLLQKEMKQNEEWQTKFTQLETAVQSMQDDLERKWITTGQKALKELHRLMVGRRKTKRNLHRLNEGVNLLEKHLEEQKRLHDKLIAAEVQSRRHREAAVDSRLNIMEGRLSSESKDSQRETEDKGSKSLNDDIIKMKAKTREKISKVEETHNARLEEIENRLKEMKDGRSDLEEKVESLEESSAKLEKTLSSMNSSTKKLEKNVETLKVTTEKLQEGMSTLKGTNSKIEKELTGMQLITEGLEQKIGTISRSLNKLEDQEIPSQEDIHKKLIKEIDQRIKEEATRRETDIKELKKRMKKPFDEGKPTSSEDVAELQDSVKKLAETIQIVKTITGLKIQTEQRNRTEQCRDIEEDVRRLKTEIEKMKRDDEAPGQQET